MMYIVTAYKDTNESECRCEIAGVFSDEEKAYEAKRRVEKWMKNEDYENSEVFVSPYSLNRLNFHELYEQL